MEPKTKQTDETTASVTSVKLATRKVIPAKVAKTARGVRAVKAAHTIKKAEAVTPTEPIKLVKTARAVTVPVPAEAARIKLVAQPVRLDLSKPQRLSTGQRTYIRRLKQLAHQEGVAYHAPLIQRATAK